MTVDKSPTIESGKERTYFPRSGTVVVTILFTDLADTVIRTKIIEAKIKLFLFSVIAKLNCWVSNLSFNYYFLKFFKT